MSPVVRISDYEWFDVHFDDNGEPDSIIRHEVVWSVAKPAMSKMLSERLRRIVELARKE